MIDNPTTTSLIGEPHCANGTGESIYVLLGYNWPPVPDSSIASGAGAGAGAGAV